MDAATARARGHETFAARSPLRELLANGVELHYVEEGTGTPLVFVHGAMGDWRAAQPQWDAFVPHYRCITYSRRYSYPNRNEMPSPHHSALDEAEDLRLLLDALRVDRAVVVGSSYGGFTALALALAHPHRVQALVAIEPPMMKYALLSQAGREAEAAFRSQVIEPANAAFRAGADEAAAGIMTGGINGAAGTTAPAEWHLRRVQNVRAMKALALSTDEFPLLPAAGLAALPMPVLLVSGQDTPAVHREIFKNVCAAMPQARCVRVANAGHGVAREQPGVFNRLVLDFLQT